MKNFEKVENYLEAKADFELWNELWNRCLAIRHIYLNEIWGNDKNTLRYKELQEVNEFFEPAMLLIRNFHDKHREPEKRPSQKEIQMYFAKLEVNYEQNDTSIS